MTTRLIRVALPLSAMLAVACGRSDDRVDFSSGVTASLESGAVGTSGPGHEAIAVSGCVVRVAPDGFALTSLDDALVREERGTSGIPTDLTKPNQPNRGGEQERARHGLNVSAEFTRYHLVGDAGRLATFVDREVDVQGRVQPGDQQNRTPLAITVERIHETGAACGARQDRGNDRGVLPTQDWPRGND